MNCKYAPILLFCYKRLDTLIQTVEALQKNFIAMESDLVIFSDAAKGQTDLDQVNSVRMYIAQISGFKSVTVSYASTNKGLANSIIDGVTSALQFYDAVIVVEDDLVTTPNFLNFMNQALLKYKNELTVNAISGFTFDMNKDFKSCAYFLNRPWPWTWATWRNRWQNIDWSVSDYNLFSIDTQCKKEFAKLGSDVNSMLRKQMAGKLDSWAIRWTYHQFRTKSLCLYPPVSMVKNIGFGELATHTKGSSRRYDSPLVFDYSTEFKFPNRVEVSIGDQLVFLKIMGIRSRIVSKIETLFLNLKKNRGF